ncbi:MAG: hypothetical protein K8S16_18120, partial [Bacteroidales bacterium]|nr:hypothetical protein [Bacteroidales bacterium]
TLMPLGSVSFTVNTEPYAYVAISKDGVLHGAAVADGSGVADVALDPINIPGTADVVVTRQNGQPYIGTVTVASPSGPYLSLNSFTIDDNTGNSNGEADYGETILLDVTLENLGSNTATNVSATLSSSDTYATITDNYNTWPDIPDGTTSTQNGAFGFTVSDDVPDQHIVEFDLEMTDGSEIWNSQINITVYAPLLVPGNLVVDDAIGGNGNGRLDAGETADIIIQTLNDGHSNSPSASALMSSTSPWITVNNGNYNIGSIAAGSFELAVFNITCDINTPIGTAVDFDFDLTAGNYGYNKIFYESIGLVLEDWETGGFSNFPWSTSGDANWQITNSEVYEGTYSAVSGDIGNNQISELTISVITTADDTISFFRKVSSESNYDYLQFWIDGTQVGEWAGEVSWSRVKYFVTAGTHTFKWVYDKDYSVSSGSDCAWVDYIVFPPIEPFEPDIAVNPLMLDFGDVIIGQTGILPFTIENTGSDILIGSIVSPPYYTVAETDGDYKNNGKNTVNFSIPPASGQSFEVLFDPIATNCYNDVVYINSNDPDQSTINLAVTGCGVIGPNLVYNPLDFTKTLAPGIVDNEPLILQNTGDAELDYSAQVIYSAKSKVVETVYPSSSAYWTGSCTSSAKTENSLVKAFPTDEAGWMKFDVSTIPDGATINSIEFHGYVNATNWPYWSMTPVSVDPVTADAASLYADISAEATSGYYLYENESSGYTTGWKTYDLPVGAYTDLESALAQDWFTVGIVSRDGSSTYYLYFDGWDETYPPYLVVDYTYIPTYTWLTLDDQNLVSGTILAGEAYTVDVGFNTNMLEIGTTYYADIVISSNDPGLPMATIPVELTIEFIIPYEFDFYVMLQGPYNGVDMNTNLNEDGLLPLTQPFNVSPWNYEGTETITPPINPDVVDWVLVELRTAPNLNSATSDTRIAWQAGLLHKDGIINGFDPNFETLVFYDLPTSTDLWGVIWHRNHLGIISASTMGGFGGAWVYDFTWDVNSGTFGAHGQVDLGGGVFGMKAGDGDSDGIISTNDINLWKPEAGTSGLNNFDFNLDIEVNNIDKDDYLVPN